MTTNQVFKAFTWLYSIQLVALGGLLCMAIYTATYYQLLQAALSNNGLQFEYQLSFFYNPAMVILGLGVAVLITISQLRHALRGLKSKSEADANEVAVSLRRHIKSLNRLLLPLGVLYLFLGAPFSLGMGLIGITATAPVLVGFVIGIIATQLRDKFDVPEPPLVAKTQTSWFEDMPNETDFSYEGVSADAAETLTQADAPSKPLTEAERVAAKSIPIALGSYAVLAVSLLSLLSAMGNYAPGGIGIAADFGFVIFHYVIMLPIAVYLVIKAMDLLGNGGKTYVLLPAVAAAIASIFIVPVA